MSDQNLYRVTPRQAAKFIEECIYSGLVPFVQSSPGLGKSSIMKMIANKLELKLIDHRLSTSAPEDLSGLPGFADVPVYGKNDEDEDIIVEYRKEAKFHPFSELFPLRGTLLPEGYQGWMVFLDEFNSASKAVQAASYKLILDKMSGQHHLHDNVVLTAAGNLSTDRAIVNSLSTAMQSRVVHIEMKEDYEEWLYDVALPEKYDPRIVAYISQYPGKLMDFRPDHQEKTFCCPRTWEFTNRLIKGKTLDDGHAALLAGTITSGTAVDFVQFTKVFHNLVRIEDILQDPVNCRIPQDAGSKWAITASMMEWVTEENFGDFSIYANRFDLVFRILFFRTVLVRHPSLRQHPAFIRALSELSRYLNG